jgi:putative transcriptional regulator
MKRPDFHELLRSVRQAGRIQRGEMRPARVTKFKIADVKTLRSRLGQTQIEFASMIGVSVATLRNWEQGRRRPEGPALALLRVVTVNPALVAKALHVAPRKGAA